MSDGKSQFLLDFAIVGGPGMKGRYSVSDNEIVRRYVCEQGADTAGAARTGEYSRSKILLVKEIIGRVIKSGVGFGYALADSWFAGTVILVGSPLRNEKTEMLYKRIIANECHKQVDAPYSAILAQFQG